MPDAQICEMSTSRRRFLSSLGASLAIPAGLQPNILLIVADDLGFADLGAYGGEIRTPNLDRMARQGMRFSQFYNCAVCVATRASLMTGLHPRFGSPERLRPGMSTIAETLRDAGYATIMSGKWHLGSEAPHRPIDRGFDEYYGVLGGSSNYFNPDLPPPQMLGRAARGPGIHHNARRVAEFPDDYYTTEAFTDHAVGEVRKRGRSGQPFFLHLAYTAPHFPLQARPGDVARYRGRYRRGYFQLRQERYRRQKELGVIRSEWQLPEPEHSLGPFRYDYDTPDWPGPRESRYQESLMEIYAAMVESMDRGIGKVMAALRETGADPNTLTIFFSDNGGCASLPLSEDMPQYYAFNRDKPMGGAESYLLCGPGWAMAQSTPFRRYKVWTYEGGISTPMIAHWPGHVPPNTWNHDPCHVVDLLPTFSELAKARYSGRPPLEGQSLTSTLAQTGSPPVRGIGWFLYGGRAYREGRWKAVWGPTAAKWELYDMDADRTETTDLAARHPDILRRLSTQWQEWAARTGAPTTGTPADWSVY